MNKREAKRNVCSAVSRLLFGGHNNEFIYIDENGNDFLEADFRRLESALDELVEELYRRGIGAGD